MEMNQQKTQTKCNKKVRCPLCNRMLFGMTDTGNICLEVKCTKCKNIFEITIEDNHIHYVNDKMNCNEII